MKFYIDKHIIFILALGLIFFTSCKQVVIKVESIPENTPPGQPIYVTGNFNNWDPGEEIYILTLGEDSNYFITLPPGFGIVNYKFTRGDWTTVEKDICGGETDNRSMELAAHDTVINRIESWSDLDPLNCPKLTILINNVPENTPKDDIIAIASSDNSWDPDDASIFKEGSSGELYVTINRPPGINILEYKMTRGDLSTSESDEFGNELPNRVLEFGKKDTVRVNIEGWRDIPESRSNRVVFIINKLPDNTPVQEELYLVSNLNSWVTNDKNYMFQVNKNGQLYYPVPRKKLLLEYKITRGDWNTQEVDRNGYDISNRIVDLQSSDTVYIDIARWKDMGDPDDDMVTVILSAIPESTPINHKLYIAGTFNGWDPGKLRHRFRRNINGEYYVNLPKKDGDIEMRITRGSWETAQIDKYGSDMAPYKYRYTDLDTLFIKVENWKDKPPKHINNVTLVINRLPIKTPDGDNIFLATDFNGWDPKDNNLIFDKLTDGRPVITVPTYGKVMEYKITRGGWRRAEVDKYGNEIENRRLFLGFADTVYIEVKKWRDFGGNY